MGSQVNFCGSKSCQSPPVLTVTTTCYFLYVHTITIFISDNSNRFVTTFRPRWTRDITQSASATCLWRYHFCQRLGSQRPPRVVIWGQKLEVGVCTAWAMEERERKKWNKKCGKKTENLIWIFQLKRVIEMVFIPQASTNVYNEARYAHGVQENAQ